jgi:arylsulfatase A-like enzyme
MGPGRHLGRAALALLLLAAAACGPGEAPAPRASGGDPDIVLVVVDTLRPDQLPCYGAPTRAAPFLAELAERSLVFEEVWSTSTWTAPATASLFTSTDPERHGVVTGMWAYHELLRRGAELRINRIRRSLETLPQFLATRGYTTFGVSANPNVSAKMGFRRGFEHFQLFVYNGIDNGRAEMVVDQALAWAPELRAARPFFLYLHFMDPHEPYVRNERWIDPDAPPARHPVGDRAAYASEIRYLDEQLRRLADALDLLRDAVVIVVADHGQEFEEHGGLGHGFQLHAELSRVPLIVHLPGEGAPRGRVAGRASVLDVLPTLRALLGAPPSPQDAGLALLRDGQPVAIPARDLFLARVVRGPGGDEVARKRAVGRGEWKLILSEPQGRAALYDLAADPGEQRDLAWARPQLVHELRGAIERHSAAQRGEAPEAVPFQPSASELEALRRLGYADEPDAPRAASEPTPPASPAEAHRRP